MSPRVLKYFIGFCMIAGVLGFMACPALYSSHPRDTATSASPASKAEIQKKAMVFDLEDPEQNGRTKVGIMAAFDPVSHAFWWRATPMIAEPGMLESYYQRCPFERSGTDLLNFCVRGNEVVVSTTGEFAQNLDQGLENAAGRLRANPGLLMSYHGPNDRSFNLQQAAGVDMNTPEGVAPTVVRSIKKTASGWNLDVTCSCGNAIISLNEAFGFAGITRN